MRKSFTLAQLLALHASDKANLCTAQDGDFALEKFAKYISKVKSRQCIGDRILLVNVPDTEGLTYYLRFDGPDGQKNYYAICGTREETFGHVCWMMVNYAVLRRGDGASVYEGVETPVFTHADEGISEITSTRIVIPCFDDEIGWNNLDGHLRIPPKFIDDLAYDDHDAAISAVCEKNTISETKCVYTAGEETIELSLSSEGTAFPVLLYNHIITYRPKPKQAKGGKK